MPTDHVLLLVPMQQPADVLAFPVSPMLGVSRGDLMLQVNDTKDNWMGLKDAKERKKRQNRLNQRASRQRKLFKARLQVSEESYATTVAGALEPLVSPKYAAGGSCTTSFPRDPVSRGLTDTVYFPLTADHRLLHVVSLNVSRAILTNFSIISLVAPPSPSSCCSGLRTLQPPQVPTGHPELQLDPSLRGETIVVSLPVSLIPTLLQQQIPHLGWIDLFPSPRLRDNLILAFVQGCVDEDDLTVDLIGGIFDHSDCGGTESQNNNIGYGGSSTSTDETSSPNQAGKTRPAQEKEFGLISWSDPWDVGGWEITEKFARKWSFLLKGCEDVVAAANRWRDVRGEEPLVAEV